jgi:hypothetical protein
MSELVPVAVAAASATSAAARFGTRHAHGDLTGIDGLSVQSSDSCFGFILRTHLDEREAALAAGSGINRYRNGDDIAVSCEQVTNVFFIHFEREVADEELIVIHIGHVPGN